MRFLLACVLLLAALSTPSAGRTTDDRPRIGLVLSGGGARGAAHVGVLKVLEELRIPIDAVVGTSMGSLVGGGYASGLSPDEMERRIVAVDWSELFTDDPPREHWPIRRKAEAANPSWDFSVGLKNGEVHLPKGTMSGQKVQLFFADLVKNADRIDNFDDLAIPFRAVATNLENGTMEVFSSGSLAEAMRASMSVPGLFTPMEINGRIYVDGGLVRNLPIDVARGLGVDVIIAVNLGSSYLPREQLSTIVGVAGQMIAILTEQNVEESLRQLDPEKDVLIVPDLGDMGSGDFDESRSAIALGERAARAASPRLRHYSLGESEYESWQDSRSARRDPPVDRIDEVRISGTKHVNPEIFSSLDTLIGERRVDQDQVAAEIQRVYASRDFERISYRFDTGEGKNLLIVDALEKSWGPGYVSLGLGLRSDNEGENVYGLRASYRRPWLNDRGAEWSSALTVGNETRFYTELYQPFSVEHPGFVVPYVELGSAPLSVFVGDNRIARYDILRARVGADIGANTGESSMLRGGLYFGSSKADLDTGDKQLDGRVRWDSGFRAEFLHDTLDSTYAPSRGDMFRLELAAPLEALGAESEYSRLGASWIHAKRIGDDRLVGMLRGGTSFGAVMPYYEQFAHGGFLNLSGYAFDQFRGNDSVLGGLIYYRKIADLTPPLGRGLYLGGSMEIGRQWNALVRGETQVLRLNPTKTRYGGSLFFAADTWLGPFYVAWGLSGEGNSTVYVLLGQP